MKKLCLLVAALALAGSNRHSFFISASPEDRKSTRLNSSHTVISYAVFCLKKKKKKVKVKNTLECNLVVCNHIKQFRLYSQRSVRCLHMQHQTYSLLREHPGVG